MPSSKLNILQMEDRIYLETVIIAAQEKMKIVLVIDPQLKMFTPREIRMDQRNQMDQPFSVKVS